MIVAVTGTPGTGKTRFAKALAKALGWKLIPLNALAARKGYYRGTDRKRKSKIVDLRKLGQEITKLAKARDLVIESHYAHELPCDAIVVLRTPIQELTKRLQKRKWPQKKIEENVEAEIMEVVLEEARSRRVPLLICDSREPGALRSAVAWIRSQNG